MPDFGLIISLVIFLISILAVQDEISSRRIANPKPTKAALRDENIAKLEADIGINDGLWKDPREPERKNSRGPAPKPRSSPNSFQGRLVIPEALQEQWFWKIKPEEWKYRNFVVYGVSFNGLMQVSINVNMDDYMRIPSNLREEYLRHRLGSPEAQIVYFREGYHGHGEYQLALTKPRPTATMQPGITSR